MSQPVRVLFVCLGNICRSPMAEAMFRRLLNQEGYVDQIIVDSAGTGDWHIGHPPDKRAVSAASARGLDLSNLRARQITAKDLPQFDYIVAMDQDNVNDIESLGDIPASTHLRLFLSFSESTSEHEVPDPYYGGDEGFDRVLNLLEHASDGLLKHIVAHSLS